MLIAAAGPCARAASIRPSTASGIDARGERRSRACRTAPASRRQLVRRDELRQPHDDAVVVDRAELFVVPAVGAALERIRPQLVVPVPALLLQPPADPPLQYAIDTPVSYAARTTPRRRPPPPIRAARLGRRRGPGARARARTPLPGRAARGRRSRGTGRPARSARRGGRARRSGRPRSTRIWSADFTVRSRCAMTNVVRPFISSASACWIRYSVSVSTLDVESSNTRIFGSSSSVRAIEMRCFWPPESVMPRSPTQVS